MLDTRRVAGRDLIAVVDDDESLGRALARLLTGLGYRVEVFASAEHFLNCANDVDACCLVLDIDLGRMSGLDLARELSASGLNFPIIFMTGSRDEAVRKQCRNLGCVDFLRKPFLEARLLEAIATVNATHTSYRHDL